MKWDGTEIDKLSDEDFIANHEQYENYWKY